MMGLWRAAELVVDIKSCKKTLRGELIVGIILGGFIGWGGVGEDAALDIARNVNGISILQTKAKRFRPSTLAQKLRFKTKRFKPSKVCTVQKLLFKTWP